MATETRWASSHITGAFSNPDDALGATNGTWAGDLNLNSSYTSRWAMEDPSGAISTATQTINVVARKGSNSGNPAIALNLYENGTLVGSLVGDTSITSTTGQTVSGTFSGSVILLPSNVEIEVVQTAAAGGPTARNCAQIDSIEWIVELAPPAPDELTADNLDAGTPTLGTPALAQSHTLTASALTTGTPSLGAPALAQTHVLVAAALDAGAPTLGTPALSEGEEPDALIADGLDAGVPTLGTPALAQTHILAASVLDAGTPSLGIPSLAQTHTLVAAGLTAGAASLGAPAFGQEHVLLGNGITTGAPTLGIPALDLSPDLIVHHLVALELYARPAVRWFPRTGDQGGVI
jgi:hypothetical protein